MNDIVSFDDTSIAFKSKSNNDLFKSHLLFGSMNNNTLVRWGTALIKFSFSLNIPIKGIVKKTLFNQFCGGETIGECKKVINDLASFGIGTVLDYSVEGEQSEKGFEHTVQEILKTIEVAERDKNISFCVFKVSGIGSVDLLEKVQKKQFLTEKEESDFFEIIERIDKLCKAAFDKKVKIFIDAEQSWIQDTIDELVYKMMEKYNREQVIVFNTFQLYRKGVLQNLKNAFKNAQSGSYYLGAKLVRGAYMEKERERASENGYHDPIQISKEATDEDFNNALIFCIENIDRICLCSGTHNEESNYLLVDLIQENNLPFNHPCIHFAQLYGMSDHISYNLANKGFNVAKYVPYGPVKSVMPYLFRRANENTAIKGQSSRELKLIKKEISRRRNLK
ncbi:MAG TPA: proline dehydrogenase family protein [Cytophagales bacterium]|nr:proline dehydrogenase family protein [Cytophagales bacterium]